MICGLRRRRGPSPRPLDSILPSLILRIPVAGRFRRTRDKGSVTGPMRAVFERFEDRCGTPRLRRVRSLSRRLRHHEVGGRKRRCALVLPTARSHPGLERDRGVPCRTHRGRGVQKRDGPPRGAAEGHRLGWLRARGRFADQFVQTSSEKEEPATAGLTLGDAGTLEPGMVGAAEFQWPYRDHCIGVEDLFLVTEDEPINLTRAH